MRAATTARRRLIVPSPADTLTAHCAECGHQWSQPLRLPMPLDRFATYLTGVAAAGCPACGAHNRAVLCGPASSAPTPGDDLFTDFGRIDAPDKTARRRRLPRGVR
jgi:hypothetical protein